jgi:NADPH:quinone reductase-like Zn-dependent oxidoreductase
MKYRHVVVRRTGGPEVLQIAEDDLPTPISGKVLVKILAADVGFSDVNIRRGCHPDGPQQAQHELPSSRTTQPVKGGRNDKEDHVHNMHVR